MKIKHKIGAVLASVALIATAGVAVAPAATAGPFTRVTNTGSWGSIGVQLSSGPQVNLSPGGTRLGVDFVLVQPGTCVTISSLGRYCKASGTVNPLKVGVTGLNYSAYRS